MLHLSVGITAYILTITFLLGCAFGSFADCAAMRLVSGESVLTGRSHCDQCGHVLGPLDLIPLVSWMVQRGRCRYCGAKIPAECFVTELFSGLVCMLIVYRFDVSLLSLRILLLWVILLILSLTDLHAWIIPDRLILLGTILYVVTALFLKESFSAMGKGILFGSVLGGGMLVLSMVFDRITGKESLGGGDIKLFFMTGLYLTSAWELLFYLILSCMIGLIFAAVRRTERLPFGPSIAAACMVMLLYGEPLTAWYTGLF